MSFHFIAGVGLGEGPVDGPAFEIAVISPSQYFLS
jgi:hypothetical protein